MVWNRTQLSTGIDELCRVVTVWPLPDVVVYPPDTNNETDPFLVVEYPMFHDTDEVSMTAVSILVTTIGRSATNITMSSDELGSNKVRLLTPTNDPVILPETFNDPVTINPSGKLTNPSKASA